MLGAVVAALKAERNPHVYAAATRFVATYLAASPIHDDWFPLLTWLFNRPKLRILVATDHYAEATPWISQELARGGIPAIPLGKSERLRRNERFSSPIPPIWGITKRRVPFGNR